MIVEFRRLTLLPLDDVLGCLKDSIPKLTRSSLHRCLERHGISRLLESEEKASKRGRFADTTIGYVHFDISSCGSLKANSTCSWRSTGSRSSPMSNSMRMPVR